MYHAKGPFWPAIGHLLATSLRSLLRHFAPPANANYARSALFAKANIGFRLFAAGLGPLTCSPVVEHEIPIPVFAWSLMFAKANIGFCSMPGFHAPIAKTISMINAWYKGKDIGKNVLVPPMLTNCSIILKNV